MSVFEAQPQLWPLPPRDRAAAPPGDPPGQEVTFIFKEDPDLIRVLSDEDQRLVGELFRARVVNVTQWPPQLPRFDPARTFGLLVLDGLLGRRLCIGRSATTQLMGVGDILRPWEAPPESLIEPKLDWCVFLPARLAILDARITYLMGRRPELVVAFASRLQQGSYAASLQTAIGHMPRVEDRLLTCLRYMAGRWGRVTGQGVYIPFRLTHQILGEIIGARRSTVSLGLSHLQRLGAIVRNADGFYVLTGEHSPCAGDPGPGVRASA